MTYKQVVDHIGEIALAAGAASFWYGKETAKDINYDAAFPQVYLFLVPSGISKGRVTNRVRMCFYGRDEQNSSSEQSLLVQDAMDVLSQQFIAALEEAGLGEFEQVDRSPVLRQGSTIGTGFFVSFNFTTLGEC